MESKQAQGGKPEGDGSQEGYGAQGVRLPSLFYSKISWPTTTS
jgi:hypothetical protein